MRRDEFILRIAADIVAFAVGILWVADGGDSMGRAALVVVVWLAISTIRGLK